MLEVAVTSLESASKIIGPVEEGSQFGDTFSLQ